MYGMVMVIVGMNKTDFNGTLNPMGGFSRKNKQVILHAHVESSGFIEFFGALFVLKLALISAFSC